MNVLLVEDKLEFAEENIIPVLRANGILLKHVTSLDCAISEIENQRYDYVILDLAIPENSALSSPSDVVYGTSFFAYLTKNKPGIPILVLTGQRGDEIADFLIENPVEAYFWNGVKEKNIIKFKRKRVVDIACDLVVEACRQLAEVEAIELIPADNVSLSFDEKRILRLFTKTQGGVIADVDQLNDGLSDASVFRIDVKDSNNSIILKALGKIGKPGAIDEEFRTYKKYSPRLQIGSAPNFIDTWFVGAQEHSGAFYQFADDYSENLFLLARYPEKFIMGITNTREILRRWHDSRSPAMQISICELRRKLLSDDKVTEDMRVFLGDVDWENFEKNLFQSNSSVQHGDLHCANVLVSNSAAPVIIDFNDVGSYPCGLDPVTLELSFIFHSSNAAESVDLYDSSPEVLSRWFDLNYITTLSGEYGDAIKFLRDWASSGAFADRQFAALVYSYSFKQLKYPDTDKAKAKALIKSAIDFFRNC